MSPSKAREEPGGLIPPYDDRTEGPGDTSTTSARTDSVERQLADTDRGRPGATTSPAREQPVRPGEATAPAPETPLGVGESVTRRGEDVEAQDGKEAGRADLGTKGRSERPVGTSDQRASTGVDPQNLADDGMPNAFTGDQGG